MIIQISTNEGAVSATGVDSAAARSSGKLCALRSCITSIPKTSTVQNICPGVQHTTLTIKDGLVEVETVQVECHRGDAKGGEPDADNRPCSKEEVQGAGVVE